MLARFSAAVETIDYTFYIPNAANKKCKYRRQIPDRRPDMTKAIVQCAEHLHLAWKDQDGVWRDDHDRIVKVDKVVSKLEPL